MPTRPEELLDAALVVLAERGPLTEVDLVAALLLAGHDLRPDPAGAVADLLEHEAGDALVDLPDGRLAALHPLLDGRVLAHRLTGPEVTHGVVAADLDLTALTGALGREARWTDGTPVQHLLAGFDDDELAEAGLPEASEALVAPAGALDGAGVGDLVGLRRGPDGWSLAPVVAGPGELGAAAAGLLPAGSGPVPVDTAVVGLCAADPALFTTPLAPVRELLSAAGLVVTGEWVALPGTDVEAWHQDRQRAFLAAEHGLDDAAAGALLVLLELHDEIAAGAVRPRGDDADVAARRAELAGAAARLADPTVAAALLAEAVDTGDEEDVDALAALARSLEQVAPRGALAGVRWVRAAALELLGETLEAESALEAAVAADPEHPAALLDLARCAGDRGDGERALSLLRRAGVPGDDEELLLLEEVRERPRPGLGRNERCWCGSGRKYKQCHLGREGTTLAERADWLHAKALRCLERGRPGLELRVLDEVHEVALADAGLAWEEDGDRFLTDVALAEGGGLAAFLATRGVLLPDDERSAAAAWVSARRTVLEVLELPPRGGARLRDLRDGAEVVLADRGRADGLRVGDVVCARPVPVGEELRAPGGVEVVRPGWRDELLAVLDAEPSAAAVARALTLATRTDHPE
ncbi:hypothetical protein GCM10027047_32460 [Rhodococcus aerolatus]